MKPEFKKPLKHTNIPSTWHQPNSKFEWDRNASHRGPSTLALGLLFSPSL